MASTPIRTIESSIPSYELTFVGGDVVCVSNPATIGLFWVLVFLMIFNSYILIRLLVKNKYQKDGE
jgi:hypothetical protein